MSLFKCKMCGGTIEFEQGATVGVCDSCGTKQTLPRLDDNKANLYDRANHFRRNNDFDKAMGIYEQILNEDGTDAEAYWSIVLCRYGIEYVEDPASHKRIPTVNRAQFTSIFADEDYKSAIKNADVYQRSIYEEEAKAIDDIQKGILEISSKEEPFDVFICYKETDSNGRRTQDSVLANDLYHQLTQEGFKVFFSRITLEDKLGVAYEPYIFAALNSAKVMVALGTKPEYFQAVWVKNEWSRYLALIKSGAKKMLIPAYKDMDPYNLPEEFSHLQAQDMSKLGFMQDLIRGIKKIAGKDENNTARYSANEIVAANSTAMSIGPLLKRAFMFLEDEEWEKANDYCEQVLDQDPECAEAYLVKLMIEQEVNTIDELGDCESPFDNSGYYRKVVRFGEAKLLDKLNSCLQRINERQENSRLNGIYNSAYNLMNKADSEEEYKKAAELFNSIEAHMDSKSLSERCIENAEECRKQDVYSDALLEMVKDRVDSYEKAIELFSSLSGWRDSSTKIDECKLRIDEAKEREEAQRIERELKEEEKRKQKEQATKKRKMVLAVTLPVVAICVALLIIYKTVIIPLGNYKQAIALKESGNYSEAINAFEALNGYKDSVQKIEECNNAISELNYNEAVSLKDCGNYVDAIAIFDKLGDYKDSIEMVESCHEAIKEGKYQDALNLFNEGSYEEASYAFGALAGYKDSDDQVKKCQDAINEESYNKALALMNSAKYEEAIQIFKSIESYKDSTTKRKECEALNNAALKALEAYLKASGSKYGEKSFSYKGKVKYSEDNSERHLYSGNGLNYYITDDGKQIDCVQETTRYTVWKNNALVSDTFYIYASPYLRIRSEPTTDSKEIGQIQLGGSIKVLSVRDNWGKVSYNGKTGWISMDYVDYSYRNNTYSGLTNDVLQAMKEWATWTEDYIAKNYPKSAYPRRLYGNDWEIKDLGNYKYSGRCYVWTTSFNDKKEITIYSFECSVVGNSLSITKESSAR